MHPTQNQAGPVAVTPAETLRAAAVYLQRHGWTQSGYYSHINGDGWPAACALGAIGMAAHGRETDCPEDPGLSAWPDFYAAQQVLSGHLAIQDRHIHPFIDDCQLTIGDWNDLYDQTVDTVIAALRAAADDWDRIHGGAQ